MTPLVPVDGKGLDWPRKVANAVNRVTRRVETLSAAVSGGNTTTTTAGEALGGHRAVHVAADGKAYYSSPDATARLTIGVTTGAAALGADATIQTDGEMEEASWSWTDSEVIWLGASGILTQTVPTSGVAFQVGVPMGPTKMRIEPEHIAKIS